MRKIYSILTGLLPQVMASWLQRANAQATQTMIYQSVLSDSNNLLLTIKSIVYKRMMLQSNKNWNYVEAQNIIGLSISFPDYSHPPYNVIH